MTASKPRASDVVVEITNDYSDGHHSESRVVIEGPADGEQLADWFERVVYEHTGDGHGLNEDLGSCYTATIVIAQDESLVGKECEWTD